MTECPTFRWRADIDALEFPPAGHGGRCAVHRLAFRALLGHPATPGDALAFFAANRAAFEEAAARKIAGRALAPDASLHLTSRDVARMLDGSATASPRAATARSAETG